MLFDDNLNFFGFTIPKEVKYDKTYMLESVYNGFNKGNMFKDEYDSYKNYKVKEIEATSEKEKHLLEIMALSFAINDLNLYLDLHPEDTTMLEKFKKLVETSCEKEMEYVKCYGPLEVVDSTSSQKFNWINNHWPWENEGGTKYV